MILSHVLYTATGGATLRRVRFLVQSDFAKSGTNYWTINLRVRSPGQTYGIDVAQYATNQTGLTARTPVTIYEDAVGWPLSSGDVIVATMTSTGTVTVFDDPVFLPRVQAKTR